MAYHHSQQGQWDSTDALNDSPPPPPAHRHPVGMHADPNNYSDYSTPGMTPSDGMSEHSAGRSNGQYSRPMGVPENITPFHDQYGYEGPTAPRAMYPARSNNSNGPYASGGMGPGVYSSSSSMHSGPPAPQGVPYSDTPYNRYSSSAQNLAPQMGQIDPNSVADDDDWGMGPNHPQTKRRSFVPPFGHSSRDGSRNGSPGSSIHGGAGAAAAGGAAGASAYVAARDGGKYNAVPNVNASSDLLAEKSDWAKKNDLHKRKKRMWIAIAIIAVIMIGAILGGVLGAMLNRGGGGENGKSGTTADDIAQDNKNDLGKNSAEIKALMNNPDLHKVFPGMDYTPLNAQYPDCLHVGPSQNNITRDMAVMSQLTNAVRLYGTDCNQTQMLIHAIDRLEIKDTMKLWLGVWLDSNHTTTQRQIDQTWKILDDYGCDYFKGIIIGNEVLFRKDLTPTELIGNITEFRQNITAHNCQLPVAMADLGDNWDADMASKVDVVMSNVHPFFAGVDVSEAAGWTWSFWQREDVSLTANDPNIKQVIAEVGWPSGGGKSCGQSPTCGSDVPGSVAGVTELNQFMEDWICPSLKNGTEYFWFSAFDEPWKIRYNEDGKEWEDKWGLMDVNRNLKNGVKIPTCDGLSLPS